MKKYLLAFSCLISFPLFLFADCHDSTMVRISRSAPDSDPLVNDSKTVTKYNTAEKIISKINYNWDGAVWVPSGKDSFAYQFDTIVVLHIQFSWSLNHWGNYFQEIYTYQNDTQITNDLSQFWVTGAWQNNYQTIYNYSPTYKLTLQLTQQYNGGWIDQNKLENFYNGNDSIIQQTNTRWAGTMWLNTDQTLFYYDANNNDTLKIYQQGDSSNWNNYTRNFIQYDTQHRMITSLQQGWNQTQWVNLIMLRYYYGGISTAADSMLNQQWNSTDSLFHDNFKKFYRYDALGRTIQEKTFDWNGSAWYEYGQHDYIFTGNLLTYESQMDGDSIDLVYEYYNNYFYDVHNHLVGSNGYTQGAGESGGESSFSFDQNGIWTGSSGWWSTQGGFMGHWQNLIYYNTINGDAAFCNGNSNSLSVDSCQGYTFLWSTGETTSSLNVTTPGNYSVDVYYADGYHTYTEPIDVIRFDSIPNLPAGIDSTTNICVNDYLSFFVTDVPGVSYQWFRNDTLLSGRINASTAFSGAQLLAGYYYLVAYNSCGTDTSAKTFVNLSSVPVASITASGATTFCAGDSVTLTANSSASYLWSPGNQTTQSITVGISGTYYVNVYNAFGCHSDISQSVTVHPYPSPLFIYQSSGTLHVNYTGGFNQWYLNGDTIAGATTNSFTPIQAGYYSYSSAIYLPCITYSDTFYFDPFVLSIDAGLTRYACMNGSVYIGQFVPASGGTPPYTYQWFPTTGLNDATQPNPILSGVMDTAMYFVTVTDAMGLTASDSVLIILDLPPQPVITSTFGNTFCEGASVYLQATFSGGSFSTVNWFINNAGTGTTNSFYYVNQSGVYSVTVRDVHSCANTSDGDTIYKLPHPQIPLIHGLLDTLNCLSGIGTFYVNSSQGIIYNWYQQYAGLISTDTLIHTTDPVYYTLMITDSNGCTDGENFQFDLSEQEIYMQVLSSPSLICDSGGVTLSAPVLDQFSYQWYLSLVPITGATNYFYQATATGSYQVEAINTHGCDIWSNANVNSFSSSPVSISLYNDILYSTTNGTLLSYQWFFNGTLIQNAVGNTYQPTQPGIYYCSVQGNNACPSISNQIYYQVCAISNITSTNASSFGNCDGSTSVSMNGTSPFTYMWSTTETTDSIYNLCAGTYYFTVTDSLGCSVSDSVIISQPQPVCSVTINITNNIFCNGDCTGSLNAVANGISPIHFLWSTNDTTSSINNLCAGIYSVLMTDHVGCMDSATVTIAEPSPIVANYFTSYGCGTCTTDVVVSGGTFPYTYQWCDGSTAPFLLFCGPGLCTVYITDGNGCINQDTIILNPPPPLSLSVQTTGTTCAGCSDGTLISTATGGVFPYTFLVTPGNLTCNNCTNMQAGTYTVCVTDANGCTVCDTVTVADDPTGIFSADKNGTVKIYPNPFTDQTILEVGAEFLSSQPEFVLTDVLGNRISSFEIEKQKTIISRKNLSAGIYFYQINSGKKNRMNGKLVVVDE